MTLEAITDWLTPAIRPLLTAGAAVLLGLAAHGALDLVLKRRAPPPVQAGWSGGARRASRVLLMVLAALAAVPVAGLPGDVLPTVRRWLGASTIAAAAWLLIELAGLVERVVSARFRVDVEDNLQARRVHTRFRLLRRAGSVAIVLLAAACTLTLFPSLREIGISLFASAGVAGLVLGLAARPTLSNWIAGLQVAFAEPIRLDDVVIVEGEWGRIEEITLTYVVVRIWDDRRLVVPLSRFIDQPFENWTRQTADLLGTVFLYADYDVDVERLREALRRILEASELWDGRVWNLQVTGATERAVELRALMSAANAPDAWSLRCHVREELVRALREEQPTALPRVRARLEPEPSSLDRSDPQVAGVTGTR